MNSIEIILVLIFSILLVSGIVIPFIIKEKEIEKMERNIIETANRNGHNVKRIWRL